MTAFLIALQFLTTFPIQLKSMPTKQQNAYSLLFYPLIGLLIGLILFSVISILYVLPIILLSTILLVLWIWLTGGLHLDGLADTADAWVGGYGDRERTLKIMKDPACGPIGVLSLIILCLVKWSCIYVLLQQKQYIAIVLFPVLGRVAPLFLFLTTKYVREKGLGSSIAEFIPKKMSLLVLIISLCLSLYFLWVGLFTVIITCVILFYLRKKFVERLGGITGDTIGASIEIVEASGLLSFTILSFYLLL